jgi:hypothetical protein
MGHLFYRTRGEPILFGTLFAELQWKEGTLTSLTPTITIQEVKRKETHMKKITTITAAILLTTGIALAEEQVIQQHKKVQEKAASSITVHPDSPGPAVTHEHDSTKVEKREQTTTTLDTNPVAPPETTQQTVEMKKKSATTVTTEEDSDPLSSTNTHRSVQSKSQYEHTSKEATRE